MIQRKRRAATRLVSCLFLSSFLLAPIPMLAQNIYVFNSAGVSSLASSLADSKVGATYEVYEVCTGSNCSGALLSPTGYKDNGISTAVDSGARFVARSTR